MVGIGFALGTCKGSHNRHSSRMRRLKLHVSRACATAANLALASTEALAHASERGHVLLLPTQYYWLGGALAVLVTFLISAFVPAEPLERAAQWRIPLARSLLRLNVLTSLLSFAVFLLLVAAGFVGSRDPLSNPLPLVIWTLLWVGLTVLQGLFGNIWAWINPWYGPWWLAVRLGRRLEWDMPPFRLPARLGGWPAVALLFLFAWFELIYPAPDDPAQLALVALCYWLFTFAGMLAFGFRAWSERVEFLTVFFGLVARLSLLERVRTNGRPALSACLPAAKLASVKPLSLSGVAFLLVALGSVSFDGFMRTFTWLGAIGVNPLEYPGRTALIPSSTFGLVLMIAALAASFFAALALGNLLAGGPREVRKTAGLMIWSIVPIALAYHVAHYVTALLVNGQYALAAVSDPFSNGWNLFGTAGYHVSAGIVLGAESARIIWNLQAGVIIGGHMLAVIIAHVLAHRIYGSARQSAVSQIPLALLMICYTVFGLWLLSTPAGA